MLKPGNPEIHPALPSPPVPQGVHSPEAELKPRHSELDCHVQSSSLAPVPNAHPYMCFEADLLEALATKESV